MNKRYKLSGIILGCMVLALEAGCGGSGSSGYSDNSSYQSMDSYDIGAEMAGAGTGTGGYENSYTEEIGYEEPSDTKSISDDGQEYEQKIVYTCTIEMETLEYNETIEYINSKIEEFDGIIESEYEYDSSYDWYYSDYTKDSGTMSSQYVIRIPAKSYEAFLSSIEGTGKIKSKRSSTDNITQNYYETATIIDALRVQESRLLEMLNTATTIDEMISVESRLTEVQTEINTYQTQLNVMDTLVSYSTINLNISEVFEYTPENETRTFFDRLKTTVSESWKSFGELLENLLFFVIRSIPYLVVYIPLLILLVFILTKISKKNREKAAKKRALAGTRNFEGKPVNDANRFKYNPENKEEK